MRYEFYAGSYGGRQEENIAKYSLDGQTREIMKLYACSGAENPSWLTLSSGGSVLYAVEELAPQGNVRAFQAEDKGLKPLACISAKGADPCHICLDEAGRYLFTANYSSGSLAVCWLDERGIPVHITDFFQDTGCGSDPVRQEGPHIHFAKISGERVFIADLGTDKVLVCKLDAKEGRLTDTGKPLKLPAGAGPRHLEFHPNIPGIIYVACELGSSVAVFREKEEEYVLEAMESTLPEGFSGENTVAAIRIRNNQLYVSNRGHDSIAVFAIREAGGLALRQIIPTGGRIPRDFAIMGEYMVIANQGSDDITVLRIASGRLEQTDISVPMSRPACICPVPASLRDKIP